MLEATAVITARRSTLRRDCFANAQLSFAFRPQAELVFMLQSLNVKSELLDRNLPTDFDDLIVGKTEEIADLGGIAFHRHQKPLLPARQALAVTTPDHRLVTHIIGNISKIYRSAQRLAGPLQVWHVRTYHEASPRFRAPDIWHDFLNPA